MKQKSTFSDALSHFATKPMITIATGATCAYLGDERNLREYLVADETACHLRNAGHTVFSLLIDDSLDPLDIRQLRIAMNKDEEMIEKHRSWCGKPIGLLPDPWGRHSSFAAHFEQALLDRLNCLGCHFTPVSTVNLYERGLYAPYVRTTLERHAEIMDFLTRRFQGYQPEKLFWPICPECGYIDETRLETVRGQVVSCYCRRCERAWSQTIAELKGKLNWKLDCAARWAMLDIDAEPFNKAYLEPVAGSFVVAQALSMEFFGARRPVLPLRYGLVKMEKQHSYKLLSSLPPDMLRHLMVERATSDLTITQEGILHAAARYQVLPGMSFRGAIEQLLPAWLLSPETLSPSQRALVTYGISFAKHFLGTNVEMHLPAKENLETCSTEVLRALHCLMEEVLTLRGDRTLSCKEFSTQVQARLGQFGELKSELVLHLRRMVGQERGLPIGRVLFLLSIDYLALMAYMLDLAIQARCSSIPPVTLRLAA